MTRKVKILAALGVVALVLSAVIGGVALAQGGDDDANGDRETFLSRVASHLGVTEEQLRDAFKAAEMDMLDEALQEGRITQERADELRQRIEEGDGFGFELHRPFGMHRHFLGGALRSIADILDMTPQEVLSELKEGQSLAEIAEAKGMSRDYLKSAILSTADEKLNQAVADGRLTQEQADEIMDRLTDNLDKILDWERGVGGPLGMGGMMPRGIGRWHHSW